MMHSEIAGFLKQIKSVLITAHERPDGDAIGSALALEKGLQSLGIRTVIMLKDTVPEMYKFLAGTGNILTPSYLGWQPEAIIALDSTEWERVGAFSDDILQNCTSINIDHHPSNKYFADLNWVEPQAAATGEMVLLLLKELKVLIDLDMATATDTGFFRHGNTSPQVLMIAAELAKLGANPAEISGNVHGNKSLNALKALGLTLNSLQLSTGGKVAWAGLNFLELENLDVKEEELEGLVNYPGSIKGVEVGLFFKEATPNEIRVSLRSGGAVDVNTIAEHFGGGGHKNAAGCTLKGSWGESVAKVVSMCRKQAGEL
ncbi:MAG: bifunctional oligoribonuclease/PAP phosphatase NrnA [Bacillota bacterium]